MPEKKQIKYEHINPLVKKINSNSTKKIYHYTSPHGLDSIIKNSTLRFSDVQFLNDKSEYIHIEKPLRKAFMEVDSNNIFDCDQVIELLDKKYETENMNSSGSGWQTEFEYTKMRYYVFCTSKSNDSLSMWNYYLKNGNYQGYSIGFTVNQLLNCFDSIDDSKITVLYGDVIYSEDDQVKILANILLDINNRYQEKLHENKKYFEEEEYEDDQGAFLESLSDILGSIDSLRLFFKDNAFRNENEFRFVLKLPKDDVSINHDVLMTDFVIKHGIFTPYCDLTIDKSKTINSIMIAPIMEGDIAKCGLERILKCYKYNKEIKIIQSDIPIRY